MKVADLLSAEDVFQLAPPDKVRLLQSMSRHAAERLGLDAASVGRALADRELLGSTGVGHGIALPHARLGDVRHPFGLFAALTKPIEFGAVDDLPVDLVFLLILPTHVPEEQLRCLACVARRLKEPGLPQALRKADNTARFFELLVGP